MAQFSQTPIGGIDDMLDNASEMLLRTNPKLTTNVKLMTNGKGLWMESYSADKALSDSRYKSVRVSPLSSYSKDLVAFYDGLDKTSAYAVMEEYDSESVKDNYAAQYESFYWAGCERIDSLEYDEDMGMSAPLWISDKLPEMFVVFRVDEPAIAKPSNPKNFDFRKDILEKCTIIKTFDLTEKSPIGMYIRNYASQKGFPKSPISLSLDPESIITYNGISYKNGEFTSASEHCHELFYEHDDTILYLERHITEGFFRNGIVCANIINIEFLFDDKDADDYSINRYFGLYCNTIEDAEFSLDCGRLQYMHNEYQGNPSKFSLYEQRNLTAMNRDGVEIPFIPHGSTDRVPNRDDIENLDCVFCIKDIENSVHDISMIYQNQIIRLTDRKLKLNLLNGLLPLESAVPCTYETDPVSAQVSMRVNREVPTYTKISLWQTIGGNTILIGELTSSYLTDENDAVIDKPGWWDNDQFYGRGGTESIADAICNSFNSTFDIGIRAYRSGSTVIFSADNPSSTYESYSITIGDCADTGCITADRWNFAGACNFGHIVVGKQSVGSFTVGDYVRSQSRNGYARITAVTIKTGDCTGLHYNIITDEDVYGVSRNNTVETFRVFTPSFCRLSFFQVKDFNYSTYGKSIWGEMGELDYEKSLIENITSETASDYAEIGDIQPLENTEVDIEDYQLEIIFEPDEAILPLGDEDSYTVRTEQVGDPNDSIYEVAIDFVAENTRSIESEYNKITKSGFNFATLSTSLNKNEEIYIDNEYTRCYENYASQLMLLSKSQPWICKWVADGGTDVRDNPYRLNTSPAFGQLSFCPDHRSFSPDTNLFNQEWGYIFDKVPNRMTEGNDVTKIWSYIGERVTKEEGGTIYDNDLERNLKRTDRDWFDTYFKRDYLIYGEDDTFADTLDHIRKYTLFKGGTENTSSSTFFMGSKIELIEKADWSEEVSNNLADIKKQYSGGMNGYRFTAVLIPISVTDATAIGDIKTKVIRNDVFKFVVICVYVVREYDDAISVITGDDPELHNISIDTINRYVLYSPQDNALNVENTTPITMTGVGKITSVKRESGSTVYTIQGENTNFTNDFIPYTDHNTIGDFQYSKQMLLVRYFNSTGTKMFSSFTIKDVISDTQMTAELDSDTQNPFSTYGRILNAQIPMWYQDPLFYPNADGGDFTDADDTAYFVANCDYAQFASALNRCVFGSIFHDINTMQKENVVYELVDRNGDFHSSAGERPEHTYALMFVKPKENAKYNYLTMKFNGSTIDYAMVANSAFPMFRHGWDYTPHRNEILKFKDPYIEDAANTLTPHRKYLLETARHKNTCFASDYDTFATIYNLAFHRANDRNSNVFRLKEGDRPLHPVDNKFAIGSRSFNVFNSPWDAGHYTTTLSEINETDVHGTLSMKEHKSFLATTSMKTPDTIILETFVPSETETDDATCIFEERNGNVVFDLLVEKRLIMYFRQHLESVFAEYIAVEYSYGDKTTLDDDIEAYIRQNLLSLYKLEEITFYVKETTSDTLVYDYSFINESDNMKRRNGLKQDKSIGLKTTPQSVFDRRITFNTKPKRTYTFGMSVRITRR